jgi:hypothetical protein
MNTVEFITNELYLDTIPHPVPAARFFPDWYKKMPAKADESSPLISGNTSMKMCPGIFDAFCMGYIIPAWCDFSIHLSPDSKNTLETQWKDTMIDVFDEKVGSKFAFEASEERTFIRIITPWSIKTTPGSSVLLTNPKWRPELKHKIYEGVVDADMFIQDIHVIVTMKKYSSLEIKKGDPLCQVIPFTRDPWTMKAEAWTDESAKLKEKGRILKDSHLAGGYRKEFWQEKVYK